MNYASDLSMNLPSTLFETTTPLNDNASDDMQYGDMNEQQLLSLGLHDISAKVDPYRLIRYDFPQPQYASSMLRSFSSGTKITHKECVNILFDEMKELSHLFSFWGEYKKIITELINHFRYGNGSDFYSSLLNSAFGNRINNYTKDNPLIIIKDIINGEFTYKSKSGNTSPLLRRIKSRLSYSMLPKFDQYKDRINGLGISIHDISYQKISLLSLKKYSIGWDATLHFEAQDHFGLDLYDIKDDFYRKFRFFRIWFFLQRHKDFAFKPFFTNFYTIERIAGYL